jgi:hypothetical protein
MALAAHQSSSKIGLLSLAVKTTAIHPFAYRGSTPATGRTSPGFAALKARTLYADRPPYRPSVAPEFRSEGLADDDATLTPAA